jgi:Type I restriction modification DNA specificity domain
VPLGDVVEILDNRRRPITKHDREPGPYPYYGATGVLDYVKDYLFDEPLVLVGEDGAKWEVGRQDRIPYQRQNLGKQSRTRLTTETRHVARHLFD